MFCFNCGKKLVDGAKFCFNCGESVEILYGDNMPVDNETINTINRVQDDIKIEKNVANQEMDDKEAEALSDYIAGVYESDDEEYEENDEYDEFIAAMEKIADDGVTQVPSTVEECYEPYERFQIIDHSMCIDKGLLNYSREYHAFEAMIMVQAAEIIKNCMGVKNYDELLSQQFDFIAEKIREVMTYVFDEMILAEGLDNISSTELREKVEEAFIEHFSLVMKAQETVAAYEEQLGIESQCRTRWHGGGFGITGAIKGAIKAEMMNVGTDIARGIFKSITGTTDADKIDKLKNKLFNELKNDKKDETIEAFHHMSMDFFDFAYIKLIENGRRDEVSFDREGAYTKYQNTMYLFSKDKKTFDDTFYSICDCIELNPLEEKYYVTLYRMAPTPEIKNVLLSIYADNQNSWVLASSLGKVDLELKIHKIEQFTQDEKVINNAKAAVFSQEELDALLYADEPYKGDIYLFEEEFRIPVDKKEIDYYGYGNAKIVIDSKRIVSFNRLNIKFHDLDYDEKYAELQKMNKEFFNTLANYTDMEMNTVVEKLLPLAERGEPESCAVLCKLYDDGYIPSLEKYENFKVIQKNAGAGLNILALCYFMGAWGIEVDYEISRDINLRYAQMNDIDIHYQRHGFFCAGACSERLSEIALAKKYYWKAYELGDYNSLYRFAKLEDPVDYDKVQEAAEHGISYAAYDMGKRYMEGGDEGEFEQDFEAAFKYFSDATDCPAALYELGVMYIEGYGCHKNSRMAVNFFKQAANLGYVPALVELGICYANGDGVQQNYETAVEYYEKAEGKGSSDAMYNLGICYLYGAGVEKDVERAHDLFIEADKLGNEDAKQALDELF